MYRAAYAESLQFRCILCTIKGNSIQFNLLPFSPVVFCPTLGLLFPSPTDYCLGLFLYCFYILSNMFWASLAVLCLVRICWQRLWITGNNVVNNAPFLQEPRVLILCCLICFFLLSIEFSHWLAFNESSRTTVSASLLFYWTKNYLDDLSVSKLTFLKNYSFKKCKSSSFLPSLWAMNSKRFFCK